MLEDHEIKTRQTIQKHFYWFILVTAVYKEDGGIYVEIYILKAVLC
jgi:hypothetical protein